MPSTPVVVLDSTLTSIANAIRSKTGGSATMTPGQMPAQIASIPSGGGGEGIPREVDANGVYGLPTQSFTFSLPANATDIGAYALSYSFYGCTSLTSVDLSSLTDINATYALNGTFNGCTSLTSVDLSSLSAIIAISAFSNAFYGCTNLTSVNLSSLTTVSGSYALADCFVNCVSLTSLSFPSLTTTSFGSRTNQFNSMLSGCSNVTVHFPAAIQSTIGSWSSVTSGFGGTNTTVLFDL